MGEALNAEPGTEPQEPSSPSPATPGPGPFTPAVALRAITGGFFMGLANLVPGLSGGTMLLATGIYPELIRAVAELAQGRITRRALGLLALVASAAGAGILLLAGPIGRLVVEETWILYSLFIGLTLGGAPLLWRMSPRRGSAFWIAAATGALLMAGLAALPGASAEGGGTGPLHMVAAGLLGAAAMILPGISGGYLLLVTGTYLPILEGIDRFRAGLAARAPAELAGPFFEILLPVGLGVLLGVAIASRLVRRMLTRHPEPTLGLLLGLLLGAVIGLWPFQEAVPPAPGDRLRGGRVVLEQGEPIYATTGRPVAPSHFRRARFTPSPSEACAAAGLVLLGAAATLLVGRLGRRGTGPGESAGGQRMRG